MVIILQSKLIHVISNDYEGVYVNNLLWVHKHRLTNKDWYALGQRFTRDYDEIVKYEIKQEWLEGEDSLPQYFDQIPSETLVEN